MMLRRAPLESFHSGRFYLDVANHWRGTSFVYLLLVLALCWIPFLVGVYGNWSRFSSTEAEDLLAQIPAVTIAGGVVSTDVPQPHSITDGKTGTVLAIIDTTGEIQSLDEVDAKMLLTRTQFIVRKGERETRTYDLTSIENFTLDRDRVRGWLAIAAAWGPPVVYVFMVLFSYVYRVLQALLFALIGLAFRPSPGLPLGYPRVLSMALVAETPAVIVKTVLDLIGATFPFRELVIAIIAFAYLYLGIKASGVPSPAERAPEPAPPSPIS